MGLFFVYSIKVALCLAVFYLVYKSLLSRETFHRFNRLLLMAVVIASLAIPFLHADVESQTPISNGFVAVEEIIMQGEAVDDEANSHLSVLQLLFLIYIIGVAAFVTKDIASVVSLRRLIAKGQRIDNTDGTATIVIDEEIAPFSWFKYIVISSADYRDNRQSIVTHEKAHIHRWHSLDILICNLLITFQWYNPAAWLIRRELQDIHEYEADDEVLNQGIDAQHYQLLLIRKAVGERLFSMANNMNHNSLKKRIRMMKTTKSNPWNRMKAVVTIPVAAIAVMAFASPKAEQMATTIEAESNEIASRVAEPIMETSIAPKQVEAVANEKAITSPKDTLPKVVSTTANVNISDGKDIAEKMPSFPGGIEAMMEYLKSNVKYPETAKKKGIQGRVIVNFIVDKDGNVTSPKVVRSVDTELDAEALRVVSAMPKWTPGTQDGKAINVKYTIPVSFNLNGGDKKAAEPKSDVATAVIYVDGKKITNAELKAIDKDKIESMTVIKNEETLKSKYGDTTPVIEITLKK